MKKIMLLVFAHVLFSGCTELLPRDVAVPLTVSISGKVPEKNTSQTISLTASTVELSASVNFVWYVDSVAVSTGASYAFGNQWAAGAYRIDVKAESYDRTRSGLTGFDITVQELVVQIPPTTPTSDTDDLSKGLIADKLDHPMSTLPKPAKGVSFIDPEFGTKIVRITDVQGDFGASVAKPAYSTMPAWNADETYLILYVTQGSNVGHHLFDGKTYQYIRKLSVQPTDIEHIIWSSSDPDVLYYTYSWEMSGKSLRQLIKYQVSTDQKVVVHEFPDAGSPGAYKVDIGGDPVYASWNNDLFGFRRRGSSTPRIDSGFTYRLSTDTEGPRIEGNAPQVAPSGLYYLFNGNVTDAITGDAVRTLNVDPSEHGDFTILENGQDVWASVQFDVQPYGTLIAENLVTGVVTELIGEKTGYGYPPSGTHISGHAFQQKGWMAVSVTGDITGQDLLDQEILLVDLNTSRVFRVAHHRSAGSDGPSGYWAEPHVNISPSGTRMVFASDWSGSGTVDSYVVELPAHKASQQ